MKKLFLLASLFMCAAANAQTVDDPVIMTVNGEPVLRSECEYSYNKNNSEGVIDKKSIDEYVDLFINYKLKVCAALDAKMDTMKSFINEFHQYRDQQLRPLMVTDDDMEAEARKVYDETVKHIGPDGLIKTSHILLRVEQQAPQADWDAAKLRADSIYKALKNGADFAEMATKFSQDPGSARQGGSCPSCSMASLSRSTRMPPSPCSRARCLRSSSRLSAITSSGWTSASRWSPLNSTTTTS